MLIFIAWGGGVFVSRCKYYTALRCWLLVAYCKTLHTRAIDVDRLDSKKTWVKLPTTVRTIHALCRWVATAVSETHRCVTVVTSLRGISSALIGLI